MDGSELGFKVVGVTEGVLVVAKLGAVVMRAHSVTPVP